MTVADRLLGPGWYTPDLPISRFAYQIRSDAVTTHGTELQTFAAALRSHQGQASPRHPIRRSGIRTCGDLLSKVQRELGGGPAPAAAPARGSLREDHQRLTDQLRSWAENDTRELDEPSP